MERVLVLIPGVAQGIANMSDHILNPDTKVEKLKKEVDKLKNARHQVQQSVDVAIHNEEEILEDVRSWITEVDKKITEEEAKITHAEEKAKKRCFMDLCPNFISRYNLRKEVNKEAKAIVALLKEGEFDRVAHIPASEISFKSREHVLVEIMKALKDANVNRIGLYGMAGVGKTTFIKKVARQAKESKLFDAVIMVDVSKSSDGESVQQKIADKVGLEFAKEIDAACLRADRLHQKLKFNKTLMILDDIRSRLNLNAIGIPIRDEPVACKILLTSRDLNVLSSEMGIEKNFGVGILTEEEAWDLFKKMTGNVAEHPYLLSTAKEVARRCAGLPLAIVTVAKVLKNKSYIQWRAALDQLKGPDELSNLVKRPSSGNFIGVPADVYSAIKLSYDCLETEEHKLTFLLCSLLGRKTTMFNLLTYAMGLGLFQGIITLEDARVKVETLIRQLKSSYLLLDGFADWRFSIHDVVRDVAMSIPFRGGRMLSVTSEVTLEEWESNIYATSCTAISLLDNESIVLPEELDCLQLQFLHISSKDSSLKVPDRFFARTSELKVLDLTNMKLMSLPSSITQLVNLCTLRVDKCVLKDISIIGKLKNIEILSVQQATIEELRLPEEMKQLTRLRSLNLSKTEIKVIPPELLSSLCKLEHLYLCESFVEWEKEGNACLSELKDLSCLTSLEFCIPEINIMPKDLFDERLERFKILIGEEWNWNWSGLSVTRALKLKLDTRLHQDRGVKMLMKKSEALYLKLDEQQGVKSLLYELDHEGFPNLKHLQVRSGSNIEYIVHCKQWVISKAFPLLESLFLQNLSNLKRICHGQLQPESFSRLRIIKVVSCRNLKNLFSYSVAKVLLQLEEIEVTGCENVTDIIAQERDDIIDGNELVFRQLRSLRLESLPGLICFSFRDDCSETTDTSSRSKRNSAPGKDLQSSSFSVERLNEKEATNDSVSHIFRSSIQQSFPKFCFCYRDVSIKTSNTRSTDITPLNKKILFPCKDFTSFHCLQNLTSLVIKGCKTPQYLFSASMPTTIMQLKFLEINDCEMKEVILIKEETEQIVYKVSFPQLNSLKLKNLCRLKGFCSGNSILIEFPALKRLEIDQCLELNEFIFGSISTDSNPEDTNSDSSSKSLFNEKVTFPSLETMILCRLKNLTQIYHNQLAADSFGKLKVMRVRICENLSTLYPSDKSILRRFQKLLTLDIYDCGSLQEVFNLQGIPVDETKAEVATQLTKLYLCKLPKLKFVWNEDPRGILIFQNLQLVSACKCQCLEHLFPASVAIGLSQLEILEVKECGVKEIVVKEEGLEKAIEFGFPRLSTLELSHLTELKYFYPATHTIDWPVLKRLVVSHCKGIKIFGTEDNDNVPNEIDQQQPLLLFEKVIHQLDELSLNGNDIAAITDRQYAMDNFHYVEVLRVACYDKEISGFPYFLQKFYNLKKLVVVSCEFKELFPYEEMPANTSLHSQESVPTHQKLGSLEVWRCDCLSSLAPSSAGFRSLKTLDVWNCQGMFNLISSSTARSLVQLMDMRIRECNNLTEIVADKEDVTEDEIIFPNLKFLTFQSLKILSRFCQGKSAFNFPALETVTVEQCPNMNRFCEGKLIAGKLKVKATRGRGKGLQTDDLNAAIKRLNGEEKRERQ